MDDDRYYIKQTALDSFDVYKGDKFLYNYYSREAAEAVIRACVLKSQLPKTFVYDENGNFIGEE